MTKWDEALALVGSTMLLRARDLDAHGIPRTYLRRLLALELVEQTGRGLYRSKAFSAEPHLQLAQAAKRIAHGVVSLHSALHFHGLVDEEPQEVWMTIGPRARSPVDDAAPPIRVVRAAGALLTQGVEHHMIAGVSVPVYGLAKTLVDCFRYRQHIRRDRADAALRTAVQSGLVTVDEVWAWADIGRVRSTLKPHLESMTQPPAPPPRLVRHETLNSNEADTCRRLVVPRLQAAGWDEPPHVLSEQRSFTDGRVVMTGDRPRRGRQKRADYLLRYRPDFPIAVVEAKAHYRNAADGVQQARDYAEILGLKFAYATNGQEIIEIDYTRGTEELVSAFPAPDELWARLRAREGLNDTRLADKLLTPNFPDPARPLRYYQEIAVNRTVQEILQGRQRSLLVLCTGSGKTQIAFQICWKLWSARWNRTGEHRTPKILYLADRNVLVDDPKDKDFAPFGDARFKIQHGEISKARDIYFAIYQALAEDENRPGLYREFPRDFFDLIIVDECHRGSASADGAWREILEWFEPAFQIGMTATPRQDQEADNLDYFGEPLFTYSLAQGIADGFLAPYRVHRVITDYDAAGWRPAQGELDRYGREVPDAEYTTRDFERTVALRARTEAIARHLTDFLNKTDPFAKTVVFCVNQEHASEMRRALVRLNADRVRTMPDYICRVTSDEGEVGAAHRARFQDVETSTPVILTTSHLLTTGVDAPTCRNVVLARLVGSMAEFKQIIGRGTRLRADYNKLYFNIIDYTGTATARFADPLFDGEPVVETEVSINATGEEVTEEAVVVRETSAAAVAGTEALFADSEEVTPGRFYVDDGEVAILGHLVHDLDASGAKLASRPLAEHAGERLRALFPQASEFAREWREPGKRGEIIAALLEEGIGVEDLPAAAELPDVDPFDLLNHLAYNAPLRTRRERVEVLQRLHPYVLDRWGLSARPVLLALLEKYAEHGSDQFKLPEALEVPPVNAYGNVIEISRRFGGAAALRSAVAELAERLYAV